MRKSRKTFLLGSLLFLNLAGCFDSPIEAQKDLSTKKDFAADIGQNDTSTSPDKSVDTTPPDLVLKGPETILHFHGDPFIDPGALSFDEIDGDLSLHIDVKTEFENEVGDYEIIYQSTDRSGNLSVLKRQVLVRKGATRLSYPAHFSSNMVLQRDQEIRVGGKADIDGLIELSFADQTQRVIVDSNGKWEIVFEPIAAPYNGALKIRSNEETLLENVVMGDVWLCSGQSNMEWGMWRLEDFTSHTEYVGDFSKIRYYLSPKGNESEKWKAARRDIHSVERLSQVAYFFARSLQDSGIDHPIGIIQATQGSSTLQEWRKEGLLYEKMIEPLGKVKVAGALWYQGEADLGGEYPIEMLIAEWRDLFSSTTPFYVVQLSSYGPVVSGIEQSDWALIRQKQTQILDLENTGVVVTVDIGDGTFHPPNKIEVGERLSALAKSQYYGMDIAYSGPSLAAYEVEGSVVRASFKHLEGGINEGQLKQFQIAGNDGIFVSANAVVDGVEVLISSPQVQSPTAIRFAWADNPTPFNFYNGAGFPALPFTTESGD